MHTWIGLGFVFVLGGCGTTQPIVGPLLSTGYTNTSGAHQFFDEDTFEKIDLPTLLDPERKRQQLDVGSSELERAFRAFHMYGSNPEERRSRVQDRVLAASEQRCNTYKNYLKRVESTQSTMAGIATTILGGAGAIASQASAARALAGLAGISSGIGAELKQGYFANIASQVIVPGIDLARQDLRREMLTRRSQPITFYTVEAALADGARYHGACSINTGLDRAGIAVREVSNPGLRNLSLTLGQLNLSHKLARQLVDETVSVNERDIRLADGDITYGTVQAQAFTSSPASFELDAVGYVDKYLRSIDEMASTITALEQSIRHQRDDNAKRAAAAAPGFDAAVSSDKCGALTAGRTECESNVAFREILAASNDGSLRQARRAAAPVAQGACPSVH